MPQREQQAGYTPPGPAPLLVGQWDGIDTSTTRLGVSDEKVYWSDGFFPFGPGGLRTLPDVSEAIFDMGAPIIYKLFCSNTSVYAFASNGTITVTNLTTLVTTTVTLTWSGNNLTCGACQLLPGVIAFVTQDFSNGLFIYSEALATFYPPGTTVPQLGGATVPTGIKGSSCEVYSGRLWIVDTTTLLASAPDSFLDFTVANGAVSQSDTDSFLRNRYIRLIADGGFLYTVADSSVNYISGVTVDTSGPNPVTKFTNQNADPEVGARLWPDGVVAVGRNIGVTNYSGFYLSYGATFTKISQPLDGVFTSNISASTAIVSAARVDVFGRRCLVLMLPIIDPITKANVNKLFLWDGKRWFPSSQSANISLITTWEFFGQCFAIGTDFQHIYFVFNGQSTAFQKLIQSKMWVVPEGYHTVKTIGRFWSIVDYTDAASGTFTVEVENETTNTVTPHSATYTITGPLQNGFFVSPPQAVGQMGVMNGMTIRTNAKDMTLISAMLQPELASYRG
jgi:hypothetical protein